MADMESSSLYEHTGLLPQYEFIHFPSSEQCNIHILNNRHIVVSHLCCGGTGFATPITHRTMSIPKDTHIDTYIPIQGTCDICFLEDTQLYNTGSTCSQPFCRPCLKKITNKVCPYCRGKLKNKF